MANNKPRAARTATEALVVLWQDGFLNVWKKLSQIEQVLEKRGNHFSSPELGMALKRARHLTRKGKRGAYEYIQKYPAELDNNTGKKDGNKPRRK